jgi:hypothetical protein
MTEPERAGKVDRQRLLNLSGRGRKRQIELAACYHIVDYPAPAGGCLLTDPIFSRRLRDLFDHQDSVTVQQLELLKVGRHLRLDDKFKLVVGRHQEDNERIGELYGHGQLLLDARDHPSPLAILAGHAPDELIQRAAAILLRYADVSPGQEAWVTVSDGQRVREIVGRPCQPEITEKLMI